MTTTRRYDDLVRAMLAHEAAAAACKAEIGAEIAAEFERKGAAVTWNMKGLATCSGKTTNDGVEITDPDAFIAWLAKEHPHQVKTITVMINPAWCREELLAGMAPVDDLDDLKPGEPSMLMTDDGSIVPGVVFNKGGRYLHASITGDSRLKRKFALAAKRYVAEGAPMPAIDPPAPPDPPAVEAAPESA